MIVVQQNSNLHIWITHRLWIVSICFDDTGIVQFFAVKKMKLRFEVRRQFNRIDLRYLVHFQDRFLVSFPRDVHLL